MLLQVTTKCHMNCTHCFVDANPNGQNMTDETFENFLKFLSTIDPKFRKMIPILLTGGEPLEHPKLFEWMDKLYKYSSFLLIATNGMWLDNDVICEHLRTLSETKKLMVQITNIKHKVNEQKKTIFNIVVNGEKLLIALTQGLLVKMFITLMIWS